MTKCHPTQLTYNRSTDQRIFELEKYCPIFGAEYLLKISSDDENVEARFDIDLGCLSGAVNVFDPAQCFSLAEQSLVPLALAPL